MIGCEILGLESHPFLRQHQYQQHPSALTPPQSSPESMTGHSQLGPGNYGAAQPGHNELGLLPADLPDVLCSSIPKCGGCQEVILDRIIFRIMDKPIKTWHGNCLTCHDCGVGLTEKCYLRHGNVFCKDDFYKRFGTKCAGCGQGVPPSQVVRRAQEYVYHLGCFACAMCSRQLDTGDEFYLMDDAKLVCKPDYDQAKAKELADGGSIDGDQPNKRPRTTITAKQLETLKLAYNNSPKPARHVREQLSNDTGLDMRVVQVWFQNRRAKEKRLKKDAGRTRWTQYFRNVKSVGSSGGHSPRHDKLLDADELKVDLDSSFGQHDLSNDSYSTVGNLGLDGEGASPGGGRGVAGARSYLGAATPPYLSTSRSPSLPPQFPYQSDTGLSVYTSIGAPVGGLVPGGGPASDLSNESSAGAGGLGAAGGQGAVGAPGYADYPPSPDSWLGDPAPVAPPGMSSGARHPQQPQPQPPASAAPNSAQQQRHQHHLPHYGT